MKKEAYDTLQRAVRMYSNLTGEAVDISEVKIDQPEEDAQAKAETAKKRLEAESRVQAAKENADQAQRRLKIEGEMASGDGEGTQGQPGHPIKTDKVIAQQSGDKAVSKPQTVGQRRP
jgi:hypothetical protein